MAVVTLTRHFCRRWGERVGAGPTLEGVNRMLAESFRIRKQMRLFRRDGSRLEPVKVLALYWNHKSGLILWVDEDRGAAVTVISAHTARSIGMERLKF